MSKPYPEVPTFPLLPVQAPRLQPPPSLWRVPGCKAHSWERLVFPFSLFLPPPGVSLDDEFIAGYTFFFFFFFLLPSFSSPLSPPLFGGFLDARCIAGSTSPPSSPPPSCTLLGASSQLEVRKNAATSAGPYRCSLSQDQLFAFCEKDVNSFCPKLGQLCVCVCVNRYNKLQSFRN